MASVLFTWIVVVNMNSWAKLANVVQLSMFTCARHVSFRVNLGHVCVRSNEITEHVMISVNVGLVDVTQRNYSYICC